MVLRKAGILLLTTTLLLILISCGNMVLVGNSDMAFNMDHPIASEKVSLVQIPMSDVETDSKSF